MEVTKDSEETLLLAILNSTPVVRRGLVDELANPADASARLRSWGGRGTAAELRVVRAARTDLQAVVRAEQPAEVLGTHLFGVTEVPFMRNARLKWRLETEAHRRLAVRAVLAYFVLAEQAPGRLRPCENDACRLFLVDHSRPGTARWCSMAVCGNRMKARRHVSRAGSTTVGSH